MLKTTRIRLETVEWSTKALREQITVLRSIVNQLAEAIGCKVEYVLADRDRYEVIKKGGGESREHASSVKEET